VSRYYIGNIRNPIVKAIFKDLMKFKWFAEEWNDMNLDDQCVSIDRWEKLVDVDVSKEHIEVLRLLLSVIDALVSALDSIGVRDETISTLVVMAKLVVKRESWIANGMQSGESVDE